MPKQRKMEAAKKAGRNEIAKHMERVTRNVNCGMIALWLKPWRA